ncbi:MAG: RtcB family protein [Myxococcota bacterium]
MWSHESLSSDVDRALQRLCQAEDVAAVAAMPDVHLASDICIGTVVATTKTLYPAAVGGDIGCGMAAMKLVGQADVQAAADRIFQALPEVVPIIRHSKGQVLLDELSAQPLSGSALEKKRAILAPGQLGTLGRGNHFLEVQADDEAGLWLMIHSGSRAIGPAIRDHHLKAATRRKGGFKGLDVDSEAGKAYLSDVNWALEYAAENRRRMMRAAVEIFEVLLDLSADESSFFGCHHNDVQREEIGGEMLWVHRKGAVSARRGELGIIPGSMGTESFHVEGRGNEAALNSSSHGAGRCLSRSAAFRRISSEALKAQMTGICFDHRLAPRLRDEAPSAYKDVSKVMRAQKDLTRIIRRLRPLLVYKGV